MVDEFRVAVANVLAKKLDETIRINGFKHGEIVDFCSLDVMSRGGIEKRSRHYCNASMRMIERGVDLASPSIISE